MILFYYAVEGGESVRIWPNALNNLYITRPTIDVDVQQRFTARTADDQRR